jgi:hypothetical protein
MKEEGYLVTTDEVKDFMNKELSDENLKAVAGGSIFTCGDTWEEAMLNGEKNPVC